MKAGRFMQIRFLFYFAKYEISHQMSSINITEASFKKKLNLVVYCFIIIVCFGKKHAHGKIINFV